MKSNKKEIALLQSQIKQQELLFDKSMSEKEEFSKSKILKKMIERLDELKRMGSLKYTENHQ